MGLHGISTTFYDSKAISARCSRTDWKFQQNAKYDEISGRKTRVIYLCSAEGKRLADRSSLYHLPAFVLLFSLQRWEHGACLCCPLLRKGIIAASGYLAQMWAQAPVCICLLWQAWHNTLDFAEQSRVPRNPCAVSLDSSGYDSAGLFSPALSFVVPPAR